MTISRERSHFFNTIAIVQCLHPADEDRTGERLFAYLEPLCEQAGVNLAFVDVATSDQLLAAIVAILEDSRANGSCPILHLETHAHADGVGPSMQDLIPWQGLVSPLTELNRLTRMNLLVTLAACHGYNLVKALVPGDQSPVWALLGPDEQVMPSDIRNGFQAFFRTLLSELNLSRAIESLKAADASWPETWRVEHAELFFAKVYAQYLAEHTSDNELARRETKVLEELRRRRVPITAELLSHLKKSYRDHLGAFEHLRSRFLMLDIFPENAERFPLTFEQICELRGIQV